MMCFDVSCQKSPNLLVPLQKVVHTFLTIIKIHLTYPELSERTINLTERTLRPEMVEHTRI